MNSEQWNLRSDKPCDAFNDYECGCGYCHDCGWLLSDHAAGRNREADHLRRRMRIHQVIDEIDRYVNQHIPPGSFMEAVLCNDLREACGRADAVNQRALWDIVNYLYNDVPGECWGSSEKVGAWFMAKSSLGEVAQDG